MNCTAASRSAAQSSAAMLSASTVIRYWAICSSLSSCTAGIASCASGVRSMLLRLMIVSGCQCLQMISALMRSALEIQSAM